MCSSDLAGAPIVKNRLFAFGNFENEKDARPLNTFRANSGGEAVGGNVTRVLASDASALSAFLKSSFGYDTGSIDPQTKNDMSHRAKAFTKLLHSGIFTESL